MHCTTGFTVIGPLVTVSLLRRPITVMLMEGPERLPPPCNRLNCCFGAVPLRLRHMMGEQGAALQPAAQANPLFSDLSSATKAADRVLQTRDHQGTSNRMHQTTICTAKSTQGFQAIQDRQTCWQSPPQPGSFCMSNASGAIAVQQSRISTARRTHQGSSCCPMHLTAFSPFLSWLLTTCRPFSMTHTPPSQLLCLQSCMRVSMPCINLQQDLLLTVALAPPATAAAVAAAHWLLFPPLLSLLLLLFHLGRLLLSLLFLLLGYPALQSTQHHTTGAAAGLAHPAPARSLHLTVDPDQLLDKQLPVSFAQLLVSCQLVQQLVGLQGQGLCLVVQAANLEGETRKGCMILARQ